jgi:hypothetical protein
MYTTECQSGGLLDTINSSSNFTLIDILCTKAQMMSGFCLHVLTVIGMISSGDDADLHLYIDITKLLQLFTIAVIL